MVASVALAGCKVEGEGSAQIPAPTVQYEDHIVPNHGGPSLSPEQSCQPITVDLSPNEQDAIIAAGKVDDELFNSFPRKSGLNSLWGTIATDESNKPSAEAAERASKVLEIVIKDIDPDYVGATPIRSGHFYFEDGSEVLPGTLEVATTPTDPACNMK